MPSADGRQPGGRAAESRGGTRLPRKSAPPLPPFAVREPDGSSLNRNVGQATIPRFSRKARVASADAGTLSAAAKKPGPKGLFFRSS